MPKRFYWLKLKDSFFKQLAIKKLRKLAGGDTMVIIYLKMMLLSINKQGKIVYELVDATEFSENLALDLDEQEDNVKMTLAYLRSQKLIEFDAEGEAFLPEVIGCVGSETSEAEKKRRQRKLPKLLNGSIRVNAEMLRLPNGNVRYVDEKRYGGNGMLALDRANGKCQMCGSEENIVIHHANGYSNDINDLIVLCKSCHGKVHAKSGKITTGGTTSPQCPPNVLQEIRDKREDIEKDIDAVVVNTKYIQKGSNSNYNPIEDIQYTLGILPTGYQAEKFLDILKEVGEIFFHKALEKAAKANAKNVNYVASVAKGLAEGKDFDDKPKVTGKLDFEGAMEIAIAAMEEKKNA